MYFAISLNCTWRRFFCTQSNLVHTLIMHQSINSFLLPYHHNYNAFPYSTKGISISHFNTLSKRCFISVSKWKYVYVGRKLPTSFYFSSCLMTVNSLYLPQIGQHTVFPALFNISTVMLPGLLQQLHTTVTNFDFLTTSGLYFCLNFK